MISDIINWVNLQTLFCFIESEVAKKPKISMFFLVDILISLFTIDSSSVKTECIKRKVFCSKALNPIQYGGHYGPLKVFLMLHQNGLQ